MVLAVVWFALAAVIVVAGLKAAHSRTALLVGRGALAVLYLGAGALVNLGMLLRGDDYRDFANTSPLRFVRDTWASLVVPHHVWWIALLILGEAAIGILVLGPRVAAQVALVAAIGFHVGLLFFGWGFWLWSVPMLVALALLLRAQHRDTYGRFPPTAVPEGHVASSAVTTHPSGTARPS